MRQYTPPIKGRKIRFALAGCGRIAANHFAAIAKHADRAELVDVCDTDAQALAKAVAQTGAQGHDSLTRMLAATKADIVVLSTPSGLHPEQAIETAHAGMHVMTEKPMATRWQDGIRMVRACDEVPVRLFVVKQNRRNATLQLVKCAVEKKRFGRIYMVNINVFWSRPQEYYDSAAWRGTWEFDGGAFMNQASHYVDLLDWLIGPIESIQAYTGTLARNIEVEDTGVMSIRWRSGALGSMNVTMLTYPKNLEGSITILGEKGTVRLGGVAVNRFDHWEFDGGAITNQASHYVDLVQWLVGPVESVMAKTATQARRIEAEDSGVGILKFRSGALGVIEVNVLTYPKNLEGSITILGERGSVKIGGTAVNKVEHWQFAEYDDDDKLVEAGAVNTNPSSVYGFGHEGYYRNVLAVLRGEAKPETDGRAGRKSLELILGMYESAKSGRDVPIPLRNAV
jgi:UDP-N-acetyl-2-amino-2-deoxyglucuronate dehydrogenase